MLVKINNLPINVIYNPEVLFNKTPVLFLHGFTGSAGDWNFVSKNIPHGFTPIFIDLIGHGSSAAPESIDKYSEKFQLEILDKLIDLLAIQKIILVGYSMGGRLALAFSINYPGKIKGLVLESSSFGIEDSNERNERIKSDELLASAIATIGISKFIDYWMSIPLFNSLAKIDLTKVQDMKEKKIKTNSINGLKNSLVGFSQGKMNYYGNSLSTLNVKLLFICGELDKKYCNIGKSITQNSPNYKLQIVNDCGHNVHFEKPEEFLKLLNTFLLNIRDEI